MIDQSVRDLLERYKLVGIKKSHEFLMAPFVAISLIDALSQKNIKIVGCDTWRYFKVDNWVGIVEEVGGGVGIANLNALTALQIADILKRYIGSISYTDVDLISFVFEDQEIDTLLVN